MLGVVTVSRGWFTLVREEAVRAGGRRRGGEEMHISERSHAGCRGGYAGRQRGGGDGGRGGRGGGGVTKKSASDVNLLCGSYRRVTIIPNILRHLNSGTHYIDCPGVKLTTVE